MARPARRPVTRDEPGVSQRQWQREQTMSAIKHAALPVFVRFGYSNTTAEDLAEAAGISVRTLFRYFPSGKEDIILAEMRRSLDEVESTMRSRPPGESLTEALAAARSDWMSRLHEIDISEAMHLTAQIVRNEPGLFARMFGERQMLAERLVDFFAERLGEDPVADLRPRLLAHCYVSALTAGYLASLGAPGSDTNAMIDDAIAMIWPLLESASGSG